MKFEFKIMATYEGKTKNLCDIDISDGKQEITIAGVPFFDKEGKEITYDHALELYGFDGLSQNIWDDPDYINHIKNYLCKKLFLEV